MRIHSSHRIIPAFLCMMVGLLALGLVTPPTGSAQQRLTTVDDTLEDFDDGLFNRTQLVNAEPGLEGDELQNSEEGAIQLALFGTTPEWKQRQDFNLPLPLTNMGAAVVNNRIFIIGGAANTGSGGSLEPQATVWSAVIDTDQFSPTYGEPIRYEDGINNWREEPSLPLVTPAAQFEGGIQLDALQSPAVVSVTNPNTSGDDYIYVLGGSVGTSAQISSYAVTIGSVPKPDPTELITETSVITWTAGPNIPIGGPADAAPEWGIESSSAVSLSIGGKTYVYLIGGLQVTLSVNSPRRPLPTVIYAQVDWDNNGMLVKPSDPSVEGWDRLDPVPVDDPNTQGIWNAVAFAHNATNLATFPIDGGDTATTDTAIYVMGGQLDESGGSGTITSQLYRALVNPADGSLYWTNDDSVPEGLRWNVGRLTTPLHQHAGIAYRGSIYVAGGRESAAGQPTDRVLASYIDYQLEVANLGTEDTPSYFLNSDDDGSGLRGGPRAGHASVGVPSDDLTGAVMYVFGGTGPDAGDLLSTVNFASIGQGLGVEGDPYAPEGLYVSSVYEVSEADPILQRIVWNVAYPEETVPVPDVELEYRVAEGSQSAGCINAEWSDWIKVDGVPNDGVPATPFSQDGENVAEIRTDDEIQDLLENPDDITFDRCFQYQATLQRGGDDGSTVSPSLLDVSIELYSSSSPDLQVDTIEPQWFNDNQGDLQNIEVVVRNEYKPDIAKTLEAYADEDDKQNQFFVTMFVLPASQTVFTPTLPLTGTTAVNGSLEMEWQAFALVDKGRLEAPPTEPYTTTVSEWYDSSVNNELRRIDMTQIFTQTGSYRVCIGVDAYVAPALFAERPTGEVNENLEGAEDNNFFCSDPFDVVAATGVTIQATDSRAENDGVGTGEFQVRYAGEPLQEDLQVELAITDGPAAADYGSDYDLLVDGESVNVGSDDTFTVVIPQDQSSVSIVVKAEDGSTVDQTVDLTIQDIDTYTVGTPDAATVTIVSGSDINLSTGSLTFVITRTDASEAVDIDFTLEGSATYGEHYTFSGADVVTGTGTVEGTVSMGTGQTEATIIVNPQEGAMGDVELVLANGERDRINLSNVVYLPWVNKPPA